MLQLVVEFHIFSRQDLQEMLEESINYAVPLQLTLQPYLNGLEFNPKE